MATRSGCSGDNSAATMSAFKKVGQLASVARNSRANVVLPAPFGPARIKICLLISPPIVPDPMVNLARIATPTGAGGVNVVRFFLAPRPREYPGGHVHASSRVA